MCQQFIPTSSLQITLKSQAVVNTNTGTQLPVWYPQDVSVIDSVVQWIVFVLLILEWVSMIAILVTYFVQKNRAARINDPKNSKKKSNTEYPQEHSQSSTGGNTKVHVADESSLAEESGQSHTEMTDPDIFKLTKDDSGQLSLDQQHKHIMFKWIIMLFFATAWIIHLLHDYMPFMYSGDSIIYPGRFLHICPTNMYQYAISYIWLGKFSAFIWALVHYSHVLRLGWMMIFLKKACREIFFLIAMMVPIMAILISSQVYVPDSFVPVDSSWWKPSVYESNSSQYCYVLSYESTPTFNVLGTRIAWIALCGIYLLALIGIFVWTSILVRKNPSVLFHECIVSFIFGCEAIALIMTETIMEMTIGSKDPICLISNAIARNVILILVFLVITIQWILHAITFIIPIVRPSKEIDIEKKQTSKGPERISHIGWLSNEDPLAPKYHYSLNQAPLYDPDTILPSLPSSPVQLQVEKLPNLPNECLDMVDQGIIPPLKSLPLFINVPYQQESTNSNELDTSQSETLNK